MHKHAGINAHRMKENPREKVFAEAWAERAPNTLGYILCGQDRNLHAYTPRDAEVAASVIQWLGSPVGSNWLEETMLKAAEKPHA